MKKISNILELLLKLKIIYYIKQDTEDYIHSKNKGIVLTNSYKHNFMSIVKLYYVIYCLFLLPTEIIKRLNEEILTIKLTSVDEMIALCGNNMYDGGFGADGYQKVIFLCINEDVTFKNLKRIFYHEIGHLIDKCLFENKTNQKNLDDNNFYSFVDSELKISFSKENNIFEDEYYRDDICEYFAECFAQIMCNNNEFIQDIRLTKCVINNCIEIL